MLILLAAGMTVFLLFVTLTLKATGRPMYNADISRTAKTIWGTGFAIALGIVALMLGPGVIVATWPFWVGTLVFTVAVFGGLDRLFIRKTETPRQASWDEVWRSYEDKPLPGWMLEAASSGRVTYDGKAAQVVEGRLVSGGKSDNRSWSPMRAINKLLGD